MDGNLISHVAYLFLGLALTPLVSVIKLAIFYKYYIVVNYYYFFKHLSIFNVQNSLCD